jgi:hypothetical protein
MFKECDFLDVVDIYNREFFYKEIFVKLESGMKIYMRKICKYKLDKAGCNFNPKYALAYFAPRAGENQRFCKGYS